MPSATSVRARRVALAMCVATAALSGLVVAVWVFLWFGDSGLSAAARANTMIGAGEPMTMALRLAGLAVSTPAIGLVLWGLWNAFRLFRAYAAGTVLTSQSGRYIRHVGVALLLLPVAATIGGALGSLAASWGNPDGQRHLVVSIDGYAIMMMVVGAMLVMIGWTMVDAARIADENRQFV